MTGLRCGFWAGLSGCLAAALAATGLTAAGSQVAAAAAGPPTVHLRVLLIGEGSADPTTAAWQAALTGEGVPYTLVTASGSAPSETVNLPALSSGGTGNYNGVVIADSPADYASGQLAELDAYESSFAVRQVDGYMFPSPALGVTDATGGSLDGSTGTLTQAGLAAFPELKGPIPFDAGSYGYGATVNSGAPYTPLLTNAAGHVMAGVYQHPDGDPQAGVAELALNFDYNASQTQWLLLAPGLINWVTQDTHLGLYRNYFGQDIDDLFIADNEWSRQFQCTPAATDPPDYTCPPGVANNPADTPPDVQMSAADVAYVDAWEKQTGIRLELAFNGIGACSAPTAAAESGANCTGSATDNGVTYADPGQNVDPGYPNDAAFVDAMLADQGDFNWITHTWSHLFLGCVVWQPQPLTSVTANGSGGSLPAGSYSYEITAATAYGESEPSTAQQVTVGQGGSVTLNWPEAANGFGTDGSAPGPSLAQEEASHTGGTGFWGYNIYRQDPGTSSYGLVGQVPENQSATSGTTYSFTDTGGTTPGVAPNSGPDFPTATNPGIDCAPGASSWLPASSTQPDSSIGQEIGLDQAFAAANGLTNYTPAAVVTGEHSGVENPNMPSALNATGVTTFAQDASRQPQQYSLGGALGAPRYPSNIYYNASSWPDELNEYNTLYVKHGVSLGDPAWPGDTGHCVDTVDTTCISQPATEADVLASETHIMLSHVLTNDPRVGYAHQSNLIGPAAQNGQDYGYTILTLINSMLSQYHAWFTTAAPLDQMTDVSEAQVLAEQGAWAAAAASGQVTATESGGTVTITNNGSDVKVPVTVPPGTTTGGSAFGQPYGGDLSAWDDLGNGATQTLTENEAPVITSASAATSIVGSAFSFTVRTAGAPAPALTESGALPAGVTFTGNGDGTATIAGTPQAGSGGSYPILITAANPAGGVSESFTLTNAQAPSITSPAATTFTTTMAGSYTVTTTGYPAAAITESGALPGGLSFTGNGNGTATISGTPAAGTQGSYPVTVSATNASGSTATLALTITVQTAAAPSITSGSMAFFTAGQAGAAAVTTTGSPVPAITESGALPGGLSFTDNGNGTALISGTAAATGTTNLTVKASNGISPDATQAYTVIVGQPPKFTSANSATAALGSPFSFTVKAGGYPVPSWGESGLPPGVSFTDNHDGTATLSGTPATPGTYAMPLMATNAYGSAQQTLTITVQQAPAITSKKSVNLTVGAPGSFSVQTTGSPAASITESGALPSGVSFTDNGDGTATLAGTPASGASGSYPLTITAANGVSPNATQSFTLAVNPATPAAPAINSGGSAAFTAGTQGSFSVLTTGNPAASITESGALPSGVSFTDNGDGTATLAGTPASGASGSYPLTITAANGVSPNATQSFTLTVSPAAAAPVITSAGTATFAAGRPGSFTVTATGIPVPVLSASSTPALPSGVSFTGNGDGTATLAGTPPPGSQGTYLLTIKAANSSGTASQSFLLTVNSGLAVTSAAAATVTQGSAFSFKVTTVGTPTPTVGMAGGLPPGVTFTGNTDGTGTLSGTPTAGGSFPLTFTARNATGTASQAFHLTVNQAPGFGSTPATIGETAGMAFTAMISVTGFPAPKLSSGNLPAGVSFSDNGGGAGTLAGTTAVKPGTYPVTVTAANAAGTVTKTVTLSVRAPGKTQVPAFTSPAAATATAGQPLAFTITTAGSPLALTNITRNGPLPAGLTFTNQANGIALLAGIPSGSGGGTFPLTLSAQNAGGTTTQAFVLTVNAPPAIVTGTSATATVGSGYNFTVRARGFPAPTITETGAIPQGLSWTDNGNGTATLAGAPGVAQGGVYKLAFTAASAAGTATQSFTLTVVQAPAILSAPSAATAHGKPFSFTFAGTGYPVPAISHSGSVPGLTFGTSSNGTLALSGTPSTPGTYSLTITARNWLGAASQAFTLTVS